MANHPQALKRHRQSLKRRARNRAYKTMMRNAVKRLRTAIDQGADTETLDNLYRQASRTIHRVAQKGVIQDNKADRSISRLAQAIGRSSTDTPKSAGGQ